MRHNGEIKTMANINKTLLKWRYFLRRDFKDVTEPASHTTRAKMSQTGSA